MCITFFKISKTGKYKFVIGFNREVEMTKPTKNVSYWPDDSNILGSIDLVMGGSCLAFNDKTGHFSILTNYSELPPSKKLVLGKKSRGDLVKGFASSDFYEKQSVSPEDAALSYLKHLPKVRDNYNPFNMIVGNVKDPELKFYALEYFSEEPILLPHDVFSGMSNSSFDKPYLKLEKGLEYLNSEINSEEDDSKRLEVVMADKTNYNQGTPFDSEDSIFVQPNSSMGRAIVCGTITTAIIAVRNNGAFTYREKRFAFPHILHSYNQNVDKRVKLRRVLNKIKAVGHMTRSGDYRVEVQETKVVGSIYGHESAPA